MSFPPGCTRNSDRNHVCNCDCAYRQRIYDHLVEERTELLTRVDRLERKLGAALMQLAVSRPRWNAAAADCVDQEMTGMIADTKKERAK